MPGSHAGTSPARGHRRRLGRFDTADSVGSEAVMTLSTSAVIHRGQKLMTVGHLEVEGTTTARSSIRASQQSICPSMGSPCWQVTCVGGCHG